MDELNVGQIIESPENWYASCTTTLKAAVTGLQSADVDATGRLAPNEFNYLVARHETASDPAVKAMRRSQKGLNPLNPGNGTET